LDRIKGTSWAHGRSSLRKEDEAACRSNPEWDKNRVASASAGITSTEMTYVMPKDILLSLAGRVPDLAFAKI
jgi:hypothetical protein